MNILIVDNDKKFSEKIKLDLFNYFCNYHNEVNFDIYNDNFLDISFDKKYDYIFLDIDLHESYNGINLAEHIIELNSLADIVFISSHIDFIHETLFIRPFYFIRKMVYKSDIEAFFNIIEKNIKLNHEICLNYKGEKRIVNVNKIIMIEGQTHQLTVTTEDKIFYDNRTLKSILESLPKERFVQIHKGYIINLKYVYDYTTKVVKLSNGIEINVGRSYKENFMKCVKEYIIE